jgi:hypothetical protein
MTLRCSLRLATTRSLCRLSRIESHVRLALGTIAAQLKGAPVAVRVFFNRSRERHIARTSVCRTDARNWHGPPSLELARQTPGPAGMVPTRVNQGIGAAWRKHRQKLPFPRDAGRVRLPLSGWYMLLMSHSKRCGLGVFLQSSLLIGRVCFPRNNRLHSGRRFSLVSR